MSLGLAPSAERPQRRLAVLGHQIGQRRQPPRARARAAGTSRAWAWASMAATSSAIPVAGATDDTATTGTWLDPRALSAWARSRRARTATSPRSAFVTTSTSGTSMIPALRNCSVSPDAGWTTTATVSQTSSTSVSDWPTPTVSTTTTS